MIRIRSPVGKPPSSSSCSSSSTWVASHLLSLPALRLYALIYIAGLCLLRWDHLWDRNCSVECESLSLGSLSPRSANSKGPLCLHRSFSERESRQCLRNARIAFIGDSRLRGVYRTLLAAHKLQSDAGNSVPRPHNNQTASDDSLALIVEFFWYPFVNQDWVQLLQHFQQEPGAMPIMIVMQAGLWQMRANPGRAALEEHVCSLQQVVKLASVISRKFSPVFVWIQLGHVREEVLSVGRRNVTNVNVRRYDTAAAELWSHFHHGAGTFLVDAENVDLDSDGLHFSLSARKKTHQLLMSILCTSRQAYLPSEAFCCRTKGNRLSISQVFLFLVFSLCIAVFILAAACSLINQQAAVCRVLPWVGQTELAGYRSPVSSKAVAVCCSIACFGMAMVYIYIADRTDLFEKESKAFSWHAFSFPLAICGTMGVLTVTKATKHDVLNREQTQETRGWMQVLLLVYHYTGASKILGVYFVARLVVAMYVFLSAYGHFTYCLKYGTSKWYRIVEVLLRLNLFTVILCLVMNVPYQQYYFIPLITASYLIVLLVAALPPTAWGVTATSQSQLWKIVCLTGVLSMYRLKPDAFNWMVNWYPLQELFLDDKRSLHEWSFRFGLDALAIPSGMVVALGLEKSWASGEMRTLSGYWRFVIALLASSVLLLYIVVMAWACHDKPTCNLLHTFASPLMMLAFVTMRNIWLPVRRYYSWFFELVGRYSLELFIVQYHVLLANDTHSLLVLVPGSAMVNVLVVTAVFLVVAQVVAECSQSLTGYWKDYRSASCQSEQQTKRLIPA